MNPAIDNIDLEISINETIEEFSIVNSLIYELTYKSDFTAKEFFYHHISKLESILYDSRDKNQNYWRIQLQEGIEIYFFEFSINRNVEIPRESLDNEINFLYTIRGSNPLKLNKEDELSNKYVNSHSFPFNFKNNSKNSEVSSYLLINFNIEIFLSYLDNKILSTSYYERLNQSLNNSKESIIIYQKMISEFLITLLEQMQKMPFEKKFRRDFFKLKIIELIWITIFDFLNDTNQLKKQIRLSKRDYEKIQIAKDLLIERMCNPPNLIELSKLIGLNEYKIKVGFKKIYGMPPYSLLQDYKLSFAKKLLLEGDKSVTEVAIAVGYSNFSKFSSAFKKKFGVNPSKIVPI